MKKNYFLAPPKHLRLSKFPPNSHSRSKSPMTIEQIKKNMQIEDLCDSKIQANNPRSSLNDYQVFKSARVMQSMKSIVMGPLKQRLKKDKMKENEVYEVKKVTLPTLQRTNEGEKRKKICVSFFSKKGRKPLTVFTNKIKKGKIPFSNCLRQNSILPFIQTSS